jgi:tetratricopeptide (TPR) repeat protein
VLQKDGDWRRAAQLFEESAEIAQFPDLEIANLAGIKLSWEDDPDAATVLAERALAAARLHGSSSILHMCLIGSAEPRIRRGEYQRAASALEEALAIERRPGTRVQYVGRALSRMAESALVSGALEAGIGFLDQLHAQIAELGYGEPESKHLRLATEHAFRVRDEIEVARGKWVRGVTLLALDHRMQDHATWKGLLTPYHRRRVDAALEQARSALGDAEFEAAWAKGSAMTLEAAVAYAASPEDLAPDS